MRLPSYLQANTYGIYYFRAVFPELIRVQIQKREFKRSLRTSDRCLAIKIARVFKIEVDLAYNQIIKKNMNWIQTQQFLNIIAKRIIDEYNSKILDRGPYTLAGEYSIVGAEVDAMHYLGIKVLDSEHLDKDLMNAEDILWKEKNGHLSSIISIRVIANDIIKRFELSINEDKYETFCRQVAEMLWSVNLKRKQIIQDYRKLSPHVWGGFNDRVELLVGSNERNPNIKTDTNIEMVNIALCVKEKKHKLSDIFEDYLYYVLNTEKNLNEETALSYRKKFTLCQDILKFSMNLSEEDVLYIDDIELDNVRTLKYLIERLPKRLDIRFKNKTVKDICELINNKSISKIDETTISYLNDTVGIKTIQNYTTPIRNCVEYAKCNQIVENNIFDIFNYKIKSKIKKENQGKSFSVDELNRLFTTEIYTKKIFSKSYKYWIPLILMLSGARRNEICDLAVDDIVKIDDVYCFNIKDSKTISGIRKIPIHSTLLNVGFMDFLNCQKLKNCSYLFDELKETGSATPRPTTRGNAVSKWFNNASINDNRKGYLDLCGINGDGLKLHSFRHFFINNLKQRQVNIFMIKQLVGHAIDDVTADNYSEPYNVKILKQAIEKLSFPNNDFPWNVNKHYKNIQFPWDR